MGPSDSNIMTNGMYSYTVIIVVSDPSLQLSQDVFEDADIPAVARAHKGKYISKLNDTV